MKEVKAKELEAQKVLTAKKAELVQKNQTNEKSTTPSGTEGIELRSNIEEVTT